MLKKKKKYIKQRYLFKKEEKKRLIFKSILINLGFKKKIRWNVYQNFFSLDNNSSLTRIKNICIFSLRSKSIYKSLKISRIILKKLSSNKKLPGIFKYSW